MFSCLFLYQSFPEISCVLYLLSRELNLFYYFIRLRNEDQLYNKCSWKNFILFQGLRLHRFPQGDNIHSAVLVRVDLGIQLASRKKSFSFWHCSQMPLGALKNSSGLVVVESALVLFRVSRVIVVREFSALFQGIPVVSSYTSSQCRYFLLTFVDSWPEDGVFF